MITLINKTKHMKTYELECSIPKVGGKKLDVKIGKKVIKGAKLESERVLTLLPGERRENLPDAVLESKLVKRAVEKKEVLVKRQKVKVAPKKAAKETGSNKRTAAANK